MKVSIKAGATSQSVNVFIQDSISTTGAGKTGLVFSGVTAYYSFAGAAATATAITLVTQTITGAWTSGGFVEISSANMPGLYRLDLPNAVLASGNGRSVVVYLTASGAAPCVLEIELTGWDNQDAVHGGMSALPNTACTTNASLITSGSGTDQLKVSGGLVAVTSNIKKNSASRLSFTMTDSTNHAPAPGLTVAGQVSIDGGAFVPLTNAVSAIASGDYTVPLAAADTNGNTLIFRFTATGADDLNIMAFAQP